jgi:O-antigen/teichoic acid export membrane protein
MLCAILLLVRDASDIRWVPVAQFLGEGGAAFALFASLVMRARRVALSAAANLLRSATIPAITRLLRALIFTFDVLLLGFLGKRAELGLYTAAYRVCFLVLAVQVALHSSYWAAGARAKSPALLGDVVTRAIGLAGAAGLPLVVGGMVLARPLMVLLFGSAYAPGAPMLAWLLVSIGFTFAHGAYTAALIAAGATRRELLIMTAAAFVNIAANLVVIPRYGALGAAMVTALSEGVALVLCLIAGQRAGWGVRFRALLPSAAAAAVMAGVLLLVRDHVAVLVCVGLGGVVYAAALLVFGVPEDALPLVASVKANTRRLISSRAEP